ncbi:hypothetical protein TYRP_022591 [Tyrophagus putrescentiae]|nr:hypothetical protein TYRP_022591 [Tyrophagus putrescentiae]
MLQVHPPGHKCSRPFHLAGGHALKVSLTSPCLQSCAEHYLCHTVSINPLSRRHQATPVVTKPPSSLSPFNRAKPPDFLSPSLQPSQAAGLYPLPVEPARPN